MISGPYDPAQKRKKEVLRQKRQQEKAERRRQRQQEREERPPGDSAEDPDLAGIVPGPQPKPEDSSGQSAVAQPPVPPKAP